MKKLLTSIALFFIGSVISYQEAKERNLITLNSNI